MRQLLAAVLLTTACCAGAVHPAPARAAGCVAPSIAVVVDFGAGNVQRACTGAGGSGLSVLGRTFGYTLVKGEPFVCRIAGKPAKDPCQRTPPANAYWAYFHVSPGHSAWSFSPLGAGSYTPPAGSAEGWAFGGGRAPNYPAGSALPSKPKPPPHTAPRPRPRPTTIEPPPSLPTAPKTVPAPSGTRSSRPDSSSNRSSTSAPAATTPQASVEPTTAVPSIQDVSPHAAAKPRHTSPVPTILGLSLVAVLAVVAAVLMVRRRTDL